MEEIGIRRGCEEEEDDDEEEGSEGEEDDDEEEDCRLEYADDWFCVEGS